jgi:hypothetical protein
MIALLFAFLPFVLVFLLIVYAFLWGITHLKWIIMGFVLVLGVAATCSYSRAGEPDRVGQSFIARRGTMLSSD